MIALRPAWLGLAMAPLTLAASAPPVLTATQLDGGHFSLAGARGHVVIVAFWARWCVPCRTEMPLLDAFYRAHRAEGLEMIAIALEPGASRGQLAAATHGLAFPVAAIDDAHMPRATIPTQLPAIRFYARDGALAADTTRDTSPLDAARLARIAAPLLAAPPTTASASRTTP